MMHMDIQPAPKSLTITTHCHYDRVSHFSSTVSALTIKLNYLRK
jgi:hypothetical protein